MSPTFIDISIICPPAVDVMSNIPPDLIIIPLPFIFIGILPKTDQRITEIIINPNAKSVIQFFIPIICIA